MDEADLKRAAWRRIEFASVAALAVTMLCLIIGQSAEHFAAQYVLPSAETATATARTPFNAIDYATTGATKSTMVIIGPCDGRR